MIKKYTILISFFGILLSQSYFGINIPVSPSGSSQRYPDITVDDSGNIHIVWIKISGTSKNVMYSRSEDNGATFSEGLQVNSYNGQVVAYVGTGPRIRTRGDEVFVIWADSRDGYSNTSIYMSRSGNGGITWDEDWEVSDQPHFQLYSDLEIDDSGNIHLMYYNFGAGLMFSDARYVATIPGGFTFAPSTPIGITHADQEPCDCCTPDLEIGENGDVYIAYRNNVSNIRDHFITRKSVESETFDPPMPISDSGWYIGYCPSSGPSISVNGNNIGVGFMVNPTTDTFVKFGETENLTFESALNVNPEVPENYQQNYPTVVLEGNNLHTLWVDYFGNSDIYYGIADQETGEFTFVQRVNDTPEDDGGDGIDQLDPILTSYNDNLYTAWSDFRGVHFQIYFASTYSLEFIPGDVTGDGVVDILDIVLLVNFILMLDEPDTIEFLSGDMDENGILNVLDLIQIVNIILGF